MMREQGRLLVICLTALVLAALVGCSSDAPRVQTGEEIRSTAARDTSPTVTAQELSSLVGGNTEFSLAMYQSAKAVQPNLFVSPYSISLAFSMLYAGAQGDTLTQMANVLHYALPSTTHHTAFNKLDLELASRNVAPTAGVSTSAKPEGFKLSIANALWGQKGFPFEGGFLDTLAINYGAGMRVVDFMADPEACREAVNRWISEQTSGKIPQMLGPGSLSPDIRFVLANAIYFLAAWETEFDPSVTGPATFHSLAGGSPSVQMMHRAGVFDYAEGDGYQAVALPYKGGKLDMVVLLPEGGKFAAFETSLTAAKLAQIQGELASRHVSLSLPRFAVESALDLIPLLRGMGLTAPFAANTADFSGICATQDLFVAVARHQAFVTVDEAGTEAGAATIIGGATTSLPDAEMTVNRPFIFLIRDKPTGAILFLGRVTDPGAQAAGAGGQQPKSTT